MVDDPALKEIKVNAITERIKELLKELEPLLDYDTNNRTHQIQTEINKLHEERESLTKELIEQMKKG